MAINKNSNLYIITYTVVMVVIVGALLAFLATSLKEKQDANVLNEQKTSIMKAFGAVDAEGEVTANFDEVVTVGLLTDGQFVEVPEAEWGDVFALLSDRKKLNEATDNLPIFMMGSDDAAMYVLPLVGKGLWGDIWGYVALQQVEGNVQITGIVMDHAGETPGLGAEIATAAVQAKFAGKMLYNDEDQFAVRMQKGGAQNEFQVDAITGGTKTCDGVNTMLATSIGKYESFLRGVEVEAEVDTETDAEDCDCGDCGDQDATEEPIVESNNEEE